MAFIQIIPDYLVISTIAAFVLTIAHGRVLSTEGFTPPALGSETSILFIIALMGWMPTAVDISTWNSLWTVEKIKTSGYHPTLKETIYEFNLGYWIAAGLSLIFLTLGAYLMYGTGVELPNNSVGFSTKVISLYTSTIGYWSYLIIAASAFSIMFGTCIAIFDGYARALERTTELLSLSKSDADKALQDSRAYNISLVVLSLGGFMIIALFLKHFKTLIDLATSISFLIAPFIAIANYILVKKYVSQEARSPLWLQILAYLGIAFLTIFALYFAYLKFVS